jgi:hypothetical protein
VEIGEVNMAHFAEIKKEDNKVIRVIVVSNTDVNNNGGDYSIQAEEWVENNIVQDPFILEENNNIYPETYWKQTSYNRNNRVYFAGIGMTYDSINDKFIPIPSSPSWTFNHNTNIYDPPIPYCTDTSEGAVKWDEQNIRWINDSNTKYWNGNSWIII